MSEWKCGKCGKEYSFEETIELPMIRVKTEEEDTTMEYGKTSVCFNCGYIFHRDKFRLQDTIKINKDGVEGKIEVSTVFLELNHSGYWYETMLFGKDDIRSDFCERYKTEEEAVKNHKKIIEQLRKGNFKLNITERELILK